VFGSGFFGAFYLKTHPAVALILSTVPKKINSFVH
jgi:hypothetical protein